MRMRVFWEVLGEIVEQLKELGVNPLYVEVTVETLQGGGEQ